MKKNWELDPVLFPRKKNIVQPPHSKPFKFFVKVNFIFKKIVYVPKNFNFMQQLA
jgi:hypothetical protein